MTGVSEAIPSFVNKIKEYGKTWQFLESDVIAARNDERWLAVCIVMRLSAHEKPEEEKELFKITDKIVVLHRVQRINLGLLEEILEDLGKGSIHLIDMDIVLEGFTSCDYIKEEKEGWTREQLSDMEGWPALVLRSYGKSASELLNNYNELIELLNTYSEPYDSLEQLSRKYVGLEVGSGNACCLYVVAPLYYKLDNVSLSENGELKASLKCHKHFDPLNFKLSIVYSSGPTVIDNFRVSFSEVKSTSANFIECPIDENRNKKDMREARLYLTYIGKKIRSDWIRCEATIIKGNLRLVAHEVLDEDFEGLTDALRSRKKKLFEPAISMLLHLAGFNVEPLGGIEEGLGRRLIDILAFTSDNRYLLVVGCTIEGISPDEITKIAERAKSIARVYSELNEYIEVRPVLFTSLADKDISESVKKRAKEDDVVILGQESISEILNRMRSGYSLYDLLSNFGISRVTFIS
jgi:hypothetical protein